eukprot:20001-Eustigmatos_ZCMA.PRE.1
MAIEATWIRRHIAYASSRRPSRPGFVIYEGVRRDLRARSVDELGRDSPVPLERVDTPPSEAAFIVWTGARTP